MHGRKTGFNSIWHSWHQSKLVGVVMHDIRTVLRTYWNRNDTDTFTKVTGYPVSDTLTIKEFVSIVAEYLVTHF